MRSITLAVIDLVNAFRLPRVWRALATEDILDQHRRTALGPLWLLINYFAFAATFIFIFVPSPVNATHAIYVAVGLLVWSYISDTVSQAVSLFQRDAGLIKGTAMPLTVYVMRLILQNFIRSGYALIGCIVILIFAGASPTAAWLWSALGVALLLFVSPAVVLVFGFLGVFFPDGQYIVTNLMRVAMFATPVFWGTADGDGLRGALYHWNPFTHFIAVVREPIIEGTLPLGQLGFCFGVSLCLWFGALMLLGTVRRKVALLV
jgi:lipopolysaccharide transport system permease protein